MQNDNSKGDASEIVRAGRHGLAQRSAALVRRGLVGLSTADTARVIEAGKALTSSLSSGDELTILIAKFSEVFPQYPSWSLLLMDAENEELYLWISGGKEMHLLSPGAIPAVWKFNSEEANALRR